MLLQVRAIYVFSTAYSGSEFGRSTLGVQNFAMEVNMRYLTMVVPDCYRLFAITS